VLIREKDSVKICFHIAFVASDASKPYAMLPVELPAATLDEIANSLLAVTVSRAGPEQRNPVLSRLDTLERQVEGLKVTIAQVTARQLGSAAPYLYRRKHAIVVGVDDLPTVGFSLQYAVSDARAFASILAQYGFDTTLFLGNAATKAGVLQALDRLRQTTSDEDLALFYYAGPSIANPTQGPGQRTLLLFLADSRPNEPASVLTIKDLAKALEVLPARHKLALLDGCHGTTGLPESSGTTGLATEVRPDAPVLQFFAASGNDEYASESAELGGGAFTQALIRVLDRGSHTGHGLWMHDVVAETTALVRAQSHVRQMPKLVTLSGNGEVYWSSVVERRSP
jgi:Caspase domain